MFHWFKNLYVLKLFLTVAMWNVTEEETNTLGIKHLKEYKAFQLHPQ